HDRVEVGTHVQAERGEVVAGVADQRDVGIWHRSAQAAEEPGGTDPASQNSDAHAGSLPSRVGHPGDASENRARTRRSSALASVPVKISVRIFTSSQGNRVATTTFLP